jgi:hypothetical protein
VSTWRAWKDAGEQTRSLLFIDTIMTGYLLVKLARPSSDSPDDIKAWFESFKEEEEDRAMYEAYRYFFRNVLQGNS